MHAVDVLDQTGTESAKYSKTPDLEPIPGYRLLEPLGSGGFGEVWKCEAPGGLLKAIKFVQGSRSVLDAGTGPAEEELQAIQHVKAIRHPFLLSMERVECIDGELVIVLELADKNLQDLLAEYRDAGKPGIPRDELLAYLREAAEALDLMNIHHGLQHLDIKPRNLFLVSNHVKVGDFGLVNSLGVGGTGGPPRPQLGAITPLYAAPEIFLGTLSAHSDQYSLAIVYQELLTGSLPFQGKNSRQLLMQHTGMEPDLRPLPAPDRAAVGRALAKDPAKRFACCTEFVRALASAQASVLPPGETTPAAPRKPGDSDEDVRETPNGKAANADTMVSRRATSARGESIAGHQLLRCVRSSPLAEVWQAKAPDGAERLLKILFGFGGREAGFSGHLKAFRHPALAAVEVLHSEPGRLVLATDPIEKTLKDRLQECQAKGLPGVPRAELLGYLRAAAETVDYLYRQHSIQHLGLNPRTLLLDGDRLLLADFGLAQLLWLPAGQSLARLNARYSAPELSEGHLSPCCDQYSLASIYYELCTGSHAQRGPAAKAGARAVPDLDLLPAADRAVIARALDPDPHKRWADCLEMVQALEAGGSDAAAEPADPSGGTAAADSTASPLALIIGKLVASAGGASRPGTGANPASPTGGKSLEGKFVASLPPGVARPRLEAFRLEWTGQLVRQDADTYVFAMRSPVSFWQRCMGRQPGLEVHVHLAKAKTPSAAATEVTVQIKAHDCGKEQAAALLAEYGPLLLEGARTHLQANPRRRAQERLAWHYPLEVCSVAADGTLGEAIECQGKDISLSGIGFYLPRELPTSRVCIKLPRTAQTPAVAVPASIVRVQRCGAGWYEVGALFVPPNTDD